MTEFKVGDRVRVLRPYSWYDGGRLNGYEVFDRDGTMAIRADDGDSYDLDGYYLKDLELVVETPKRDPLAYIKAELEALKDDLHGRYDRRIALEDILEHGYGISVSYKSTTVVTYGEVEGA